MTLGEIQSGDAATSRDRPGKPSQGQEVGGGEVAYVLEKKLGAGCFREVWQGKATKQWQSRSQTVAVKLVDSASSDGLLLEWEVDVLKKLASPTRPQGVSEVFFVGQQGRWNCMVMEMLDKSLEDHLQDCGRKFKPQTTALVAEQVLLRIEYLHSKGIIHRDIKPENFMFGRNDKIHHIYAIDFRSSRTYFDQKHIPEKRGLSFKGGARYASINAHRGFQQSRRDDLEAIGYMLFYFLRGNLPWSGLEAQTEEEKYRKIKEKKEETSLDELCNGHPEEFKTYLLMAKRLGFTECPKYAAMKKLFSDLRTPVQDHQFEWFVEQDLPNLSPLKQGAPPVQPDTAAREASKITLGSFCFGECTRPVRVRD